MKCVLAHEGRPYPPSCITTSSAAANQLCLLYNTTTMSLINPPKHLPPQTALRLSQQAPRILASSPKTSLPYPLSLFVASETPELWTQYENLLLSCLRTGDDRSARQCLDRLIERFGEENERIMAFKGIYEEAVATNTQTLEKILKEYERALESDGTNVVSFTIIGTHIRYIGKTNWKH